MSDDILAGTTNALNRVSNSTSPSSGGERRNSNPNIWIGSRPTNYPGGQGYVDRQTLTKEQMVQKVMSAGARRDPGFYNLAAQLLQSNFLTSSAARYPGGVASGLGNAVDVYQAYQADGGGMNFTQWLDWYSGSAPGQESRSGRGGSRGGGAYTGPVESVQVAAETDIVATAQVAAQELLGRAPTQAELDKILKRTRKAEQTQPTVQTREGPGRVTTEEGLTKEGRDAILKQVLMSSPDYAGYQIDSTMMDMFSNILSKGQAVARG